VRVFAVLRHRHIAILWGGQVLSSIGNSLYAIAFMWMATRVAGAHAGIAASAQAVTALAFGLLGGVYADRWDRRRTMIVADLGRAAAVAALPLVARAGEVHLVFLVGVGAVLGALDSLFRPALLASLPALVAHLPNKRRDLEATNSLMDATARIARTLGPSLAALLAAQVTLVHFFTLDALSFVFSALAIFSVGAGFAWRAPPVATGSGERPGVAGIARDLRAAIEIVRAHRPIAWALLALGLVSMAWAAGFAVGAPLFADRVLGRDVDAYGWIFGAYGVGNITSNLVLGSTGISHPVRMLFAGKIVLASGFVVLACAPSLPWAMAGAALAAVGGPMGDLPLLTLLQNELPADKLGKVFGLQMIVESGGYALGLLLAAPLFETLPVRGAIAATALVMAASGAMGLWRFGWRKVAG
jgi:MFS transporter, DHA3 family, macrolide efflux protein